MIIDNTTKDGITSEAEARVSLLHRLRALNYHFTAVTPATHRRVIARPENKVAADLRDVFGWSLPFSPAVLPPHLLDLMKLAGALEPSEDLLSSNLRVASLGNDLFIHSAFPPSTRDAVFFGPDTYRFAAFLRQELSRWHGGGILIDLGCGSGAGGIVASKIAQPEKLVMTDVNDKALSFARVNAMAAGVECALVKTNGLDDLTGADLIIANPPFIAGGGDRTYRDGGEMHGAKLSLDWVLEGVERLNPGGRLLMYTGSAMVDGHDGFWKAVQARLDPQRFVPSYRELDPDIFGEELETDAYRDVERIAAVGLTVNRLA